jgi:hypothetical protein
MALFLLPFRRREVLMLGKLRTARLLNAIEKQCRHVAMLRDQHALYGLYAADIEREMANLTKLKAKLPSPPPEIDTLEFRATRKPATSA